MLVINFYPEYILKIGNFLVSNALLSSIITSLIIIVAAIIIRLKTRNIPGTLSLQNILEGLIEWSLNFSNRVTNSPKLTEEIFPLIITFFIFNLTANLLGLVPGFLGAFFVNIKGEHIALFRSPNSDWNTTLALALISVFAIQYFGVKMLGWKKYLKRFFDFTNPLKLVLGLFEIIGDLTKILSLSLRLFGNVLAGEILLATTAFLVPYFLPAPFMGLELFIGPIQAFIFATLSLVFIKTSEEEYLK